jgi:hypothetical protein
LSAARCNESMVSLMAHFPILAGKFAAVKSPKKDK